MSDLVPPLLPSTSTPTPPPSTDGGGGGNWLGGLAGLAGGAISAVSQWLTGNTEKDIAQQNLQYQQWAEQRQEMLLGESWHRDDTAVQRRAADMAAAGINPLLAAGSAAGNSPVAHINAPQMDPRAAAAGSPGAALGAALQGGMQALTMSKDFAVKDAQIQLAQSQANKTNVEADAIGQMLPGNLQLQQADLVLKSDQAKSIAYDVAQLKPVEVAQKTQEIQNQIQQIRQSNWAMQNGTLLTKIAEANQRNQAILTAQNISESEAKLANLAVELDILKTNRQVAQTTVGPRIAGAYVDTIKDMDMAKFLALGVSDANFAKRISRYLHQ